MQFGAVFPQTESGTDPIAIRDYAQAVEGLGYDYLLAYDHVLGANPERPGGWQGPYTHQSLFHEPFVLFGYLAGVTERLHFATGILILPQRQTALVAKQAAQVDLLSGGRLRLGIGVGWNQVEYQALDEEFHNRGRRQAEQVEVLRQLWTERLVDYTGQYHSIPDAGIHPLPVQRPIPIWFGGGADVVLRRMARLGDGWMPNTMHIPQLAETLETLHGYLADEGRDPADFGLDVRINLGRTSEAEWTDQITAFGGLGATHLCVNTMGNGFESLDEHVSALSRFRDAVSD